MSGGGSSPPAQPSTTTQIQDIPAWEQGYVTDLLGKAQTISDQPYQQFQGPQVAGFTGDQTQAFQNIEGAGATNQANQAAAMGQANAGANTANNIYGAGAGDINAATGYNPLAAVAPYLGAASGYNSAAASQPWLGAAAGLTGAAANAATPQGIQQYLNPYTNNVVQGLQNEANQNWNQNIMPGINDKFVGNGQAFSGRNAQVLGQAAGNFQTGLSANVANALAQGYTTAGQEAGTQAGILGNAANTALSGANTAGQAQSQQIANLLNQGQAAGTATGQQASNLLAQGNALGNLAATQGTAQNDVAKTIGALGAQSAATNLTQNQALQGVGQQQQQLNQTNLDVAQQNFQNQVNWPAQQTQYLNQIIRGLPTPTASTSGSQITPAYSVSPLSGLGGAGIGALSLLGNNGQSIGTVKKEGGLVSYKKGGKVNPLNYLADGGEPTDDEENEDQQNDQDDSSQSGAQDDQSYVPGEVELGNADSLEAAQQAVSDNAASAPAPVQQDVRSQPLSAIAPSNLMGSYTPEEMQKDQLLALARGMLTPSLGGSTAAAVGTGLGNMQDIQMKQRQMSANMANLAYERDMQRQNLDLRARHEQAYEDRGANKGSGGVNERLIQEHMKANPGETWNDAFAAVRGSSNQALADQTRRKVNAHKDAANGLFDGDVEKAEAAWGVKPASGGAKPPAAAIKMLQDNPDHAAFFDAKYGAGASKQYLGK